MFKTISHFIDFEGIFYTSFWEIVLDPISLHYVQGYFV